MYERNAIVLERYLDRYFGFDKQINLKSNYQNYKGLIEEMKQYREVLIEEDGLINLFDEIARTIQEIQAKQSKLYENNIKLEEERNKLFNDLSEEPAKLDERMQKVEKIIESNNIELKQLREEYVKSLSTFIERQKARNKITRKRRVIEENHINFIENAKKIFAEIDINIAKRVKAFIDIETQGVVTELVNVMMKNGKNEKVGFNEQVIKKAVEVRISIAQKEAEC